MKLVRIDIPVKVMKRYRQSEKEREHSVRRWWSGSGGVRNHNSGKRVVRRESRTASLIRTCLRVPKAQLAVTGQRRYSQGADYLKNM